MKINNKKEKVKWKSCLLPQSTGDKGALAMMCGKDEELQPSVVAC
jgi:hypothetical protein